MVRKPGTCSMSIDWGSTLSKATLAYINKYGRKEIIRVPWSGDIDDPDHPETSGHSGSLFGFVSSAALMPAKEGQGSQLNVGRQSLSKDENFPTKTLLLWAAGIRRSLALQNAPYGQETIKAADDGRINAEMVTKVFLEHLGLVYKLACDQAATLGLSIVHISITHPNFLCDGEEPDDFQRWGEMYRGLMRMVCGEHITISTISEGQSMAIYITEIFDDPLGSFNRKKFWDRLRHLNKSEGLPLVVLDCGGSTTNTQVQLGFFNNEHEMTASQSVNFSDWKTGVQGGSHLANFKVRALIKKAFGKGLYPGELAALLNDFEVQKRTLDWTKTPLPTITLHGNKSTSKFVIPRELLKHIFEATFQGGLDCLRQMANHMLELNRDFAVVLCGGSYYNLGLRNQVEDVMRDIKLDAQFRGINVEHVYLANCDTYWPSGVSAGAALSVLRLPHPVDALNYASIGLQTQWPRTGGGLVGEDTASFLLSKGCQILPSITVWNDPDRPDPTTFTMVCDPVYYRTPPGYGDRVPRRGGETPFDHIRIEHRKHTIPAYEQGFSFSLSDLPPGYVKISMGGADAIAFAKNLEFPREKRTLMFELTAYKINKRGRRMPNALDKRWLLRQETDAATKHVIVEDAKEIPSWCLCPGGPQGMPPVHQSKACPAHRARGSRPNTGRLARKWAKKECPAPGTRGSRPRRSARTPARNKTPCGFEGTCIEVAAPPRSISPGYESITSMSSTED